MLTGVAAEQVEQPLVGRTDGERERPDAEAEVDETLPPGTGLDGLHVGAEIGDDVREPVVGE